MHHDVEKVPGSHPSIHSIAVNDAHPRGALADSCLLYPQVREISIVGHLPNLKRILGGMRAPKTANLWGNAMSELLALSVSVAVLGGIWAFIALGPLAGFALVWAGFIAAGCFFAAGGDIKALTKTIVGIIYGAIIAWIALLIIAKVPVPALGTVWPAIVVGVTVFFLVIVASADLLSCVPANVYGYAALVGYTLSAGKLDALTAADNSNPLFLIAVSAILGGVLGYLMGQLAGVLKPKVG